MSDREAFPSFLKLPLYSDEWLWPVRVYSFGVLIIERRGELLVERFGKSQKKVLELLAAIIALGGHNIANHQLGEMLWSDAEGDLPRQSFDMTLRRLRRLIGKETVLVNSGMVSLNDRYCWLDLWVFEATLDELEKVLKRGGQQAVIVELTDQLLELYRGTFLRNFDFELVIQKQTQLSDRLSRILDLSIDFHERRGESERICSLLNKVLELQPLAEVNYRRLMSYYIRSGQPSLALYVYQQCWHVLCEGFNIPLSNEIQILAKRLRTG